MTALIRPAQLADLDGLVKLENASFVTDRLSRRSFRHWIATEHRALLVAEAANTIAGYILIIYHPGTRLARIYSIAVAASQRGTGVAKSLISAGEQAARDDGRLYLRLEVSVDNIPAIKLYETLGYQKFGIYRDYYQDHKDALRYQKRIRRYRDTLQHRSVHWLRQTTPFTCGPAALMMALHGLDKSYLPSREEEINLWREATTIYMTSGHGGCHPIGLALAAKRRRFAVEVWINQTGTLFIDGVRSEEKKQLVELVDSCFKREAAEQGIPIHYANITQSELIKVFKAGAIPLILISTFLMDRKKA
ncbi:MAG: peptidase C39 family protein, partial [Methylococcaceae bacterium]